jgi:hypothetical protein
MIRKIGYNIENLTANMSAMKKIIQQELERLDREQLEQVLEFIAFLKYRSQVICLT